LLDRTPVGAGDAAVDLGCGPRAILDLLSDRVGPSGRVVGVDADPAHVAKAAEVIHEMVRLGKPGGWVLSFEPDCESSVCYPTHPAYQQLVDMFAPVFTRNGADWRIGRRVAELYRSAGLVDVQVEARADAYPHGHTRRTIRVDLIRSMRPHVLELGLATERELDQLFSAALAHLDNPTPW
jgi:ubiquinone/menaquinone biosynthesis C-methylase UbiE